MLDSAPGGSLPHGTAQFKLSQLPSETEDGVAIHIYGNIEFPTEVTHCVERGAEGIGLYRTEFLYLETDQEPTEEVQYEAYLHVIRAFPHGPVVSPYARPGGREISVFHAGNHRRHPQSDPGLCGR